MPKHFWILAAILALGIFLRVYNFHSWLVFEGDQVKDIGVVGSVVVDREPWPLLGPDMSNSSEGGHERRFRLGPIYYYFEIISAKLFGLSPASLAYPDLLFSILTILLLYYFLRYYFEINTALWLTGIYVISFYSLFFSHSAWNVNSIPFFTVLFLVALYNFIILGEETKLKWILALGVAIGVGIQLHAILLILFPVVSLLTYGIFLKKNPIIHKKIAIVFMLVLFFNLGQIIGEQRSGFRNTRTFFVSMLDSGVHNDNTLARNILNDLVCHSQANFFMVFPIGNNICDFSVSDMLAGNFNEITAEKKEDINFWIGIFCGAVFSIVGYLLLGYFYLKELEAKRKYFLGLILLYLVASFFVMLPVISPALRYFNHTFFVPLVMLGLLVKFLSSKFSKKYSLVVLMFLLVIGVWSNFSAIGAVVRDDFSHSRIVLGQIEQLADFIIANNNSDKKVYLFGSARSLEYYKPLGYILKSKNVILTKLDKSGEVPADKESFYLVGDVDSKLQETIDSIKFDSSVNVGRTMLFHLKK